MKMYYITFRSVTFAQRGEALLTKRGEICALQRTPRWMEAQGCGYALRVWTRDIAICLELLRSQKLLPRRVYVQGVDGQLEELVL